MIRKREKTQISKIRDGRRESEMTKPLSTAQE